MSSIWITFIVLVVVNGGINAGVVVRVSFFVYIFIFRFGLSIVVLHFE